VILGRETGEYISDSNISIEVCSESLVNESSLGDFVFLSWVLFKEFVLNSELNRMQRIYFLQMAFNLLLRYYIALILFSSEEKDDCSEAKCNPLTTTGSHRLQKSPKNIYLKSSCWTKLPAFVIDRCFIF
jgi:hypothetical protein